MTSVKHFIWLVRGLLIVGVALSTQVATAGNLFHVGDVVARDWSDLFDRFREETVSIYVTTERHRDFVVFRVKGGYPEGYAKIEYAESVQGMMESAVEKAIRYSRIAKDNQADVSKEFGCFKGGQFGLSRCYSSSLRFEFFSNNSGSQTDLILSIEEDYPHDGWRRIYFGELQQHQLLSVVKRIPKAFDKAH